MLESMRIPMLERTTSESDLAAILVTRDEIDLRRIAERHIQAVIYEPPQLPSWLMEVAVLVASGTFVVPRTVLRNASIHDIEAWLAGHIPNGDFAPQVHDALLDDILSLVARLAESAETSRFILRIFTAAPTTECGFHVDTVPPGAPPWGLLRVYNGAGTAFVEPGDVTGIGEFYRYLRRRERLEADRREARTRLDTLELNRLENEINCLDGACAFLSSPEKIRIAPAGSIVAFKHLDVQLHWTSHAKSKAWIHCSPMHGEPRLVVNVTPSERSRSRLR